MESTRALAEANAALHRMGALEVATPPSAARMVALLKRARPRDLAPAQDALRGD